MFLIWEIIQRNMFISILGSSCNVPDILFPILKKPEFCQQSLKKFLNIKFQRNPSYSRREVVPCGRQDCRRTGRTDGWTDFCHKGFRNFVKALTRACSERYTHICLAHLTTYLHFLKHIPKIVLTLPVRCWYVNESIIFTYRKSQITSKFSVISNSVCIENLKCYVEGRAKNLSRKMWGLRYVTLCLSLLSLRK